MLINEIIAKETEIANEFQKVIDTHMVDENTSLEEMCCDDTEVIEEHLQRCKVIADYHNQIANIMRKYQKIKELYDYWRSGKCEYTISCMENIGKILRDGNVDKGDNDGDIT